MELAAARTAGPSCRMLRGVPLKLVVADRRTGLVQTGQELIEIGPSSLLDALLRLFELLWQQATSLSPSSSEGPLSFEDQQLLALAAAGLTDQAIAHAARSRTADGRATNATNPEGPRCHHPLPGRPAGGTARTACLNAAIR